MLDETRVDINVFILNDKCPIMKTINGNELIKKLKKLAYNPRFETDPGKKPWNPL